MNTKLRLSLIAAIISCCAHAAEQVTFKKLFHVSQAVAPRVLGADTTRQLVLATADFNAVLAGKLPIHAKLEEKAALLSNVG